MTRTALSLRGISVRRSDQLLLDKVDLDVQEGECVIVRGSNGAGKTTLLRVLTGLMLVSEGEAEVLGETLPLGAKTRRRISAALDEPAFWPWMSAHAVIRTVADLSGRAQPDVTSLLSEVGLDGSRFAMKRSKRVGHFSQGMRKRLQVACALSLPGDLLLIDEPTASLDQEGAELVWQALERRSAQGAAIVVATHDEKGAPRLDARVVTLERGRIVDHSFSTSPTQPA